MLGRIDLIYPENLEYLTSEMTDWIPSLNSLRAFEAVARHLSYQRAAEELRVTPAAVKQLVSKLEAALGTRLLKRKGRGMELTSSGKSGLDELVSAMQLISSGVQKMRRPENNGRLIITVEASFATAWLVPRLESFRASNPNVNVLVDSSQRIADLERDDVDIAIRYGVERDGKLISYRLFGDQIFPACSPALADGPPRLRSIEQLKSVSLIHWDLSQQAWARNTRRWFAWDSWLTQIGSPHLITGEGLHFSDYGQAVQAAIAGQGIVLASWPILQRAIETSLLVCPFTEKVTTDIGYDLVTSPDALNRNEVQLFVNWLVQEAGRPAPVPTLPL